MSRTTTVDKDLVDKLTAFRFRKSKTNAALLVKINMTALCVQHDQTIEDLQISELSSLLPDNTPRFIILSYEYKHPDGRISYPLVFIHYSPTSAKPDMSMAYASSRAELVQHSHASKVFELRDIDDFSEEWLMTQLNGRT